MKPSILVTGDVRAQALAHVLRSLDTLTSSHDVLYRAAQQGALEQSIAFVVEQSRPDSRERRIKVGRGVRSITIPTLNFSLLWPLAIPNVRDSTGQLPWTDKFIVSARAQNVPVEQLLAVYHAPVWSPSWPDLDALFTQTTSELLAADAKADVKLGSFVLKHFRKRRLFWAPNAPSNALLGETAFRVLHACFGRDLPVTREELTQAVAALGTIELMARASLPIHPMVAKHFQLAWYDPQERYPSQAEPRTFDEYVRTLVAAEFDQGT